MSDKSTALDVRTVVDGWSLHSSTREDSGHWVRDLDLAERAGSPKRRSIRPVIETAIKDGAISGAIATGATNSPLFRAVLEVVPSGDRGGSQETTVYYLNEAAALTILMRLRTPKAIEATKSVVCVYLKVARGEYAGPANHELCAKVALLGAEVGLYKREVALLQDKVDILDPCSDGLCGGKAKVIRDGIAEVARIRCLGAKEEELSVRNEIENDLRARLQFGRTIGMSWERFPAARLGEAMSIVMGLKDRAEKNLSKANSRANQLPLSINGVRFTSIIAVIVKGGSRVDVKRPKAKRKKHRRKPTT